MKLEIVFMGVKCEKPIKFNCMVSFWKDMRWNLKPLPPWPLLQNFWNLISSWYIYFDVWLIDENKKAPKQLVFLLKAVFDFGTKLVLNQPSFFSAIHTGYIMLAVEWKRANGQVATYKGSRIQMVAILRRNFCQTDFLSCKTFLRTSLWLYYHIWMKRNE